MKKEYRDYLISIGFVEYETVPDNLSQNYIFDLNDRGDKMKINSAIPTLISLFNTEYEEGFGIKRVIDSPDELRLLIYLLSGKELDKFTEKSKFKRYLLTDFNTPRWSGIDTDSLINAIIDVKDKADRNGCLYGELGTSDDNDTSLSRASHSIQNITYEDGMIYGDVRVLSTKYGKIAKSLGDDLKFSIKSVGINMDDKINIKKIFTWDIIEN